ncbi:type II toxin-antitoxin system VapB family antitoxin [Xanthobacteraceae bacterium Astr-EGSB]|uniref:type II toxin-antitoxin system VapB family antitoxin n=1 Tax=Astrobacterium formosum TaxID=3069710 RepID=UPI0027B2D63B|nr:type II toxin-antitoxin system VapB family antitoxin [Xanthobacteraceae bacterium Astr-EGSB]
MPLYIEDDQIAELVSELARRRGVSEQDAVKLAVTAELEGSTAKPSLEERFAAFRAAPLLPATGLKADKDFFDELSGDL